MERHMRQHIRGKPIALTVLLSLAQPHERLRNASVSTMLSLPYATISLLLPCKRAECWALAFNDLLQNIGRRVSQRSGEL